MASPTTINHLAIDLLQNILARLHSVDFASADCVSLSWNHACRLSWNHACRRVLSRPKLSSACSFDPSLQVAVEGAVNKVLSEPIRPHFAIASVGPMYNLQETHQLITAKLSSKVPVVIISFAGVIGRDVISDEFEETRWEKADDAKKGIMLTVGFVPGLRVKIIPLLHQSVNNRFAVDNFITDIWDFSASVSRRQSPAAIMMFSEFQPDLTTVMGKIDYAMSPETVIAGGCCYFYKHSNGISRNIAALALVFAGFGETQFHTVLSTGLLPISPTYKVANIKDTNVCYTRFTIRREGPLENPGGLTVLNQVSAERHTQINSPSFYIGVTKRRECSIGQENVGWVTSLAFHQVRKGNRECLIVDGSDIKRGDTFRIYRLDSTTAFSSVANASNHLRSFKQGGDKLEVFGGLNFSFWGRTESLFSGQPNVDSSLFLDNFPGVTLSGMLSGVPIARGDLTAYAEESQEQKSVRCCVHEYGAVCLIMSYTL